MTICKSNQPTRTKVPTKFFWVANIVAFQRKKWGIFFDCKFINFANVLEEFFKISIS